MSVTTFICQVEEAGYEFQTLPSVNSTKPYRVLIPRIKSIERTILQFELDDSSVLWRDFANLQPTEPAIESFSSKYGNLFSTVVRLESQETEYPTVSVLNPYANILTSEPFSKLETLETNSLAPWIAGERFEAWQENIRTMKHCYDLLNILQNENTDNLKQHFVRRNDYRWWYVSRPEYHYMETSGMPTEQKNKLETDFMIPVDFPEILTKPNLEKIARHALLEIINKRLLRVRPQLLWDMERPLSRHVYLRLVPQNLIDALWLQFAEAVSQGTKYKQCELESCKKWFALGKRNSEKKHYCDDTCKQAAYRERKAAEKTILIQTKL
jgi:hypothetical protein